MIVKIKKLSENAVIPKQATEGSVGFDIVATEVSYNGGYIEFKTGLSFELPEGTAGLLMPRSSISKTALFLSNSVGLLDRDFTGQVTFRFKLLPQASHEDCIYQVGDRIGQLVIIPVPKIEMREVEELTETSRGTGGYGSTGV